MAARADAVPKVSSPNFFPNPPQFNSLFCHFWDLCHLRFNCLAFEAVSASCRRPQAAACLTAGARGLCLLIPRVRSTFPFSTRACRQPPIGQKLLRLAAAWKPGGSMVIAWRQMEAWKHGLDTWHCHGSMEAWKPESLLSGACYIEVASLSRIQVSSLWHT